MREFFSSVKQDWKELPNSVKFWNSIVLLGLIISYMISFELLVAEWFLGSIITIGIVLDGNEIIGKHLWALFMPITWAVIILAIFGALSLWAYKKTILKFNTWLDRENDR